MRTLKKTILCLSLFLPLSATGQEAVAKLKAQYVQALKAAPDSANVDRKYLEEVRKARGLASLAKDKATERAADEEIQATCEKIVAARITGSEWTHTESNAVHQVKFLPNLRFTIHGEQFGYSVVDEGTVLLNSATHQFLYKFNWDFTRAEGAIKTGSIQNERIVMTRNATATTAEKKVANPSNAGAPSAKKWSIEDLASLKSKYVEALEKATDAAPIHRKYLDALKEIQTAVKAGGDSKIEHAANDEILTVSEKIIRAKIENTRWFFFEWKGSQQEVTFLPGNKYNFFGSTFDYRVVGENEIVMTTTNHQFHLVFNWDFSKADGKIEKGEEQGRIFQSHFLARSESPK